MRGKRWWSGVDGGMELSDSVFIWRDVVGKRWIKCVAWQGLISSVLWLLSEIVLDLVSKPFVALEEETAMGRPSLWAGLRFMAFQAALGVFILGQTFISEPEEREAASLGDLALGLLYTAVKVVMRQSQSAVSVRLRTRIRTTLDFLMFGSMCALSGFLAFTTLLSSAHLSSRRRSALEDGFRGAVLGLMYAGLQFHRDKLTLHFPLIQRGLFFALKMGVPAALSRSLTLALTLIPLGEALAVAIIPSASASADAHRLEGQQSSFSSILGREWLYATGAFFVALSWEVAHHMVRVVHTEQHVFAPPLGSSAEEAESTALLLMVLEDPETGPLVRYHAFHDLCITAETNVETWRRAAIFEETGDSYRRLINTCLRMLDGLTFRLAQHQYLEGSQAGKGNNGKGFGFFNYQRTKKALGAESEHLGDRNLTESSSSPFQDFQLCLWSARTVAALTSCSRYEDRHGIAQSHGSNVDVVSCLLSCLLANEVFLGTRPNASGGVSFEPNSLQWTVSSGGREFVELDDNWRQSHPVRKRAAMQNKAYAMADVLRTSLYQIVSAFGGGIVKGGGSSAAGLWSMAERDYWHQKKPLFGDQEAHLRKLRMFIEYRV